MLPLLCHSQIPRGVAHRAPCDPHSVRSESGPYKVTHNSGGGQCLPGFLSPTGGTRAQGRPFYAVATARAGQWVSTWLLLLSSRAACLALVMVGYFSLTPSSTISPQWYPVFGIGVSCPPHEQCGARNDRSAIWQHHSLRKYTNRRIPVETYCGPTHFSYIWKNYCYTLSLSRFSILA